MLLTKLNPVVGEEPFLNENPRPASARLGGPSRKANRPAVLRPVERSLMMFSEAVSTALPTPASAKGDH